MKLESLAIDGVLGISSTTSYDERGSFLRLWEKESLRDLLEIEQVSVANNPTVGTLRGLHFQIAPHEETKVIQCISGEVFDVVVDLREGSPSYGEHLAVHLGPKQKFQGIVVPKGFAHGYLTIQPNSTLIYFMDQPYVPEAAQGVVWDDPSLKITWPSEPLIMSDRDRHFPSLKNL